MKYSILILNSIGRFTELFLDIYIKYVGFKFYGHVTERYEQNLRILCRKKLSEVTAQKINKLSLLIQMMISMGTINGYALPFHIFDMKY